jgi:hypothetical protein
MSVDSIWEKLSSIYDDFESNITKIYGRKDLLLAVDLVYHSVLSFNLGTLRVRKGWSEGLVIGDTKEGKSDTIEKLNIHYQVGGKVTGERVTFAGLVGGVQQTTSGQWTITWSVLPLNDRGFLCIDEAASERMKEIIPSLSNVRSSGIAEIVAIQTARTNARVRLLWSCNAKYRLDQYDYGILAIRDFAVQQEDISRFDFCLITAKGEVKDEEITQGRRRKIKHNYTSEKCRDLILWAWSRKPEDIIFSEGVEELIYEKAAALASKFDSPILLVEPREQAVKVARLSISLACRLFSCDDTGEKVIVKKDHVLFIADWLNTIYCKPSMAYDKYAEVHQKTQNVTLRNRETIKKEFMSFDDWQHMGWLFLHNTHFRKNDILEQLGWDASESRGLFKWLSKHRLVHMSSKGYIKHPGFTNLLKEMDIEEKEEDLAEIKEIL